MEETDVKDDVSKMEVESNEKTANGEVDEEKLWESLTMQKQNYQVMLQENLDPPVILYLMKMFEAGQLKYEDLDERCKKTLTTLTPKQGVQFLKVMSQRNLELVANKSAYFCGQISIFKHYINQQTSIFNGPDPQKVKALLDLTGYNIEVSTGQRKYGGPPPGWEGDAPKHREISISCIPDDWYEDKLVPILSKFGRIYELRIMIDNITGFTRNFCFVKYCNSEENEAALEKIDGYDAEERRILKANFSSSNSKLFVGNIPKDKDSDEIISAFSDHISDIQDCEVFVNEEMIEKGLKNRGFCILDLGLHSKAARAKKILSGIGPEVFDGKHLKVDWAEHQYQPSEQEMSKVKACHVGNLSSEVTEDILRQTFEAYGKIFHVQKVRDYAFVHFEEREGAVEASEKADGLELCGFKIKCGLSKSGPLKRKSRKKALMRKLRGEFGRPYKQENNQQQNRRGGRGGGGYDRQGGDRRQFRQGGDGWDQNRSRYSGGGYNDRRDRDRLGSGRSYGGGGGSYGGGYGGGGGGYGSGGGGGFGGGGRGGYSGGGGGYSGGGGFGGVGGGGFGGGGGGGYGGGGGFGGVGGGGGYGGGGGFGGGGRGGFGGGGGGGYGGGRGGYGGGGGNYGGGGMGGRKRKADDYGHGGGYESGYKRRF